MPFQMTQHGLQRIRRPFLVALTVALLGVVLYRGVAILLSDPLLALANNYDMIRVQGCIKAYPVRPAEIPPQAGNADAPIERYGFRHDVGAPCFNSTEVLFARIARPLFKAESLRTADGSFSIRWIGMVKFVVFFAFVVGFTIAWWRQSKPGAALANAAVAALVLTDPAVTLYLSGFYAEFATVLFGYASIAGAALLIGRDRPPGIMAFTLLALAVAAFVGTKVQHIGLGVILAVLMGLPLLFGLKVNARVLVALAVGGTVGLALQATNLRNPENDVMRLANLTSTVLTTVLPLSDDPYRTAENIGIPRRCGVYAGLNWYLPPVRENPANHPCREVVDSSYVRLLGLAIVEPKVFGRFVGRSLMYIRPWIPSIYRGEPHLGVVEGKRRAPLPEGWFSWSRILDGFSLWLIYALVIGPSVIVAGLFAFRRIGDSALASLLTALALLPYPVIIAVIFGNGYEDSAKQMHLVFTLVLSFWVLLTLLLVFRTWSWIERDRTVAGSDRRTS